MIYIGGGAITLRSHLFHIFHTLKEKKIEKVSFCGAERSSGKFFMNFELSRKSSPNFQYNIALSEPLAERQLDRIYGFIHNVLLQKTICSIMKHLRH
jgi:Na+-transporting NADH:ubiquinone oxidoreductase subunit F